MNLMQYNLFMYCNGDPVNNVDPSGHIAIVFPEMLIIAIIAAVIVTVVINTHRNDELVSSFSSAISSLDRAEDQQEYFVYTLLDKNGNVSYVGRTKDWRRRRYEHKLNPLHEPLEMDTKNIYSGLTEKAAKGLEQALMIEHYTKHKGIPTNNQINGIGHRNKSAEQYIKEARIYLENNPQYRRISNTAWDELYNWKESRW